MIAKEVVSKERGSRALQGGRVSLGVDSSSAFEFLGSHNLQCIELQVPLEL